MWRQKVMGSIFSIYRGSRPSWVCRRMARERETAPFDRLRVLGPQFLEKIRWELRNGIYCVTKLQTPPRLHKLMTRPSTERK
jgi:hypothetical protein